PGHVPTGFVGVQQRMPAVVRLSHCGISIWPMSAQGHSLRCPLWAHDRRCPLRPEAIKLLRCREMSRRAVNGLMRRSKRHLYSTACRRASKRESGAARPSALAVLRLTISSNFVGACTHLGLPYESHRLQAIQIRKVPRRSYSNDPRHGNPCACADGGFCRRVDAGHVPWRKQQSVAAQGNKVASQGNKEPAARAALAAPRKEDAETFTDPCARFQGRGGAGSLETGHHRQFPDPQDLSDLSVVGRSWAEGAGGRPSDSRGVLSSDAGADESPLQLLSCNQHRLPQQLRQSEQPRRQLAHDP